MRNSLNLQTLLILSGLLLADKGIAAPLSAASLPQSLSAKNVDSPTATIAQLRHQQQQLNQQTQQSEQQLSVLTQRSGADIARMDQAQIALEGATARYVTDNSQVNQAKIKNARFKLVLAKRQIKDNGQQQRQLTQDISSFNKQLQQLKSQLASQIPKNQGSAPASQTIDIENTSDDKNFVTAGQQSRPTPAAKRTRSAADIAAEIAQLNARLQQQVQPTTALNPALIVAAGVGVDNNSRAAPTKPAAELASKPQASSDRLQLLRNAAEVTRSERALRNRLASQKGTLSTFNKMIIIKHSTAAQGQMTSVSYTLRPLGQDHYRAQIQLQPGHNLLLVGFYRWRLAASELGADAGNRNTDYVVTLNNSNPDLPELLLYRTSLQ